MKQTIIIAAMVLLSSCIHTTPDVISVKGFQYVLNNLDKSTIDDYLLKQEFVFKQQGIEQEDQLLIPQPLRHVYENQSTKTFIEVVYFGNRAFKIVVITDNPETYLKLKDEVKADDFTLKNTSESNGASTIHYWLSGKRVYMDFKQRNQKNKGRYVISYEDVNIGEEASRAVIGMPNQSNQSHALPDSVKADTIPADTTTHRHATVQGRVFNFPTSVLYPGDNGADLDTTHFVVNGVITDANFDNGAFRVKATDGEPVDIQIYPRDASSETANNLRLALKPGNRIKSICARAGAATVDLYSAKIYVSPNH